MTPEHNLGVRAVVVGICGAPASLQAVRWAAAEAALRCVPLQILHAAPYAGSDAPARRRAHDLLAVAFTVARRSERALPITMRYTGDAPAPTLLAAAAEAELLVIGMDGGDHPLEVIIRSTALDICGRTPCPVVVVRGREDTPSDRRPVLLGLSSPDLDAAAATAAFNDARRHGTGLIVLHARGPLAGIRDQLSRYEKTAHADARERLADALQPWTAQFPDVRVDLHLVRGHPSTALLAAAARARLVVLSTHGRNPAARVLLGSTSREVLRRSPVPVKVVRPIPVALDHLDATARLRPGGTTRDRDRPLLTRFGTSGHRPRPPRTGTVIIDEVERVPATSANALAQH